MKKKLLSFLMAWLILITSVPIETFAAENSSDEIMGNVGEQSEKSDRIDSGAEEILETCEEEQLVEIIEVGQDGEMQTKTIKESIVYRDGNYISTNSTSDIYKVSEYKKMYESFEEVREYVVSCIASGKGKIAVQYKDKSIEYKSDIINMMEALGKEIPMAEWTCYVSGEIIDESYYLYALSFEVEVQTENDNDRIGSIEEYVVSSAEVLYDEGNTDLLVSESEETVTYSYDETTCTLSFEGVGKMENYSSASEIPWAGIKEEIKNIIIPDTVTSISAYAFSGCTALESVVLPDSIAEIGYRAFENCSELQSINIPLGWNQCPSYNGNTSSNSNSGQIFKGCESLTVLEVPEGMTTIPAYGFNGADYVEKITLPSTLTAVLEYAFYNCKNLKEINVPTGVQIIERQAFSACSSLESIILPDTITKIGYRAFLDCIALKNINYPLNWTECPSYNGSNVNTSYCGQIFKGCELLTEIEVPEGVEEIPAYAFNGADYLEKIVLPSTLNIIKNHTFYDCIRLKEVEIPEGVEEIGKSAFAYCSELASAALPESIKVIGDYAFYETTLLTEIDLQSVYKIGEYAFYESGLTSVTIPDAEEKSEFGLRAFENCKSLDEIIFLADSFSITYNTNGYGMFTGCGSGVGNLKVTIGDNVKGLFALFPRCTNLTEIQIPDSVTDLGGYTFYGCTNLENVVFSENMAEIGDCAFYNCTSLKSIDLKNVTTLGTNSFKGAGLTTITLDDPLENLGLRAFEDCKALDEINFNVSNYQVTYNTNGYSTFTGCGSGVGNIKVNIGENVERISTLFARCTNLTVIQIPENVTKIGVMGFYQCSNLTDVQLPKSLKTIEGEAFSECISLNRIEIMPEAAIASDSFYDAVVQEYYCGKDVENIDKYYYRFTEVGTFVVDENNTSYKSVDGILYDSAMETLYRYPDMKTDEKYTIPSTLSVISDYAFSENSYITTIDYETSMATRSREAKSTAESLTFGESSLRNCSSLQEVTLPANTTALGNNAMADCGNLEVVNAHGNAPSISSSTFNGDSTAIGYRNGTTGWDADSMDKAVKEDLAEDGVCLVNVDKEYDRIVVLLLDHSWSMEGESLTSLKEVSIAFCNNILNKLVKDTAVCIVPYCGTNTTWGLSQDAQEVADYINKIECDDSTNIHGAMQAADRFLKVANAAEKSIMIFSDGIPVTGQSSSDGPYTSADNADYYQYANAVYNYAKGMSAGYKIYSIRFQGTSNTAEEQAFGSKILNDIQTVGYYEASDSKELIETFESLAQKMNGDSYLNVEPNQCAFYFYDASTGDSLDNVSFVYNLQTHASDKEGFVKLTVPDFNSTKKTFRFAKNGYMTYETSIALEKEELYIFPLIPEAEKPTVYECNISLTDGSGTRTDVMREEFSISEYDDGTTFDIGIIAGYKEEIVKYELMQNGKVLDNNTTGVFEELTIDDLGMKTPNPLWVRVTANDGAKESYKTNFVVEESWMPSDDEAGFALSEDGKIEFKVPGDVPFISGQTVSMDFANFPVMLESDGKDTVRLGVNFYVDEIDSSKPSEGPKLFNGSTWKDIVGAVDGKKTFDEFCKESLVKPDRRYKFNYKLKDAAKVSTGSVKLKAQLWGYGEGNLSTGEVEGKLVYTMSAKASYEKQMCIKPPVIIVVEFGGSLETAIDFEATVSKDLKLGDLISSGTVTVKVYLSAGAGLGYVKLASVTANGKGTLTVQNVFTTNYGNATLQGLLYVKAQLLGFEYELPIAETDTWVLYDEMKDDAEEQSVVYEQTEPNTVNSLSNMMDTEVFQVADRSYLENQSEWNGQVGNPRLRSVTTDTTVLMQNSIYDDPKVQLVQSDNTTMMVFLSDDQTRATVDRTKLMYSIYDENSLSWSEPKAVADDETADFSPVLATDGTDIYVAWTNMKEKMGATAELDYLAPYSEICVAKFNGTNFDTPIQVTSDYMYDCMPAMMVVDGEAHLVWNKNMSNRIWCNDDNNIIKYYCTDGTQLDVVSNVKSVKDLAIGMVADELVVSIITDKDADYSTMEDGMLKVYALNGEEKYSLEEYAAVSELSFYNNELLWCENSNLYSLADFANAKTLYKGLDGEISSSYQIIETDDNIYVLSLKNVDVGEENKVDIESFVHIYDKETSTWGSQIQITELGEAIQSANAFLDNRGNLNQILTANAIGVDDSVYSNTMGLHASVTMITPDYSLDDVIYDDITSEENGYELAAITQISNRGEINGGEYTIKLMKENEVIDSISVSEGIAPGQTVEHQVVFQLGDEVAYQSEYVVVVESNQDASIENNEKSITLGYADLELSHKETSFNNLYKIAVTVENTGHYATDAVLELRENEESAKAFQKVSIVDIKPGELRNLIITIDASEMTGEELFKTIYMDVIADSKEKSTGDNSAYYTLRVPEENVERKVNVRIDYQTLKLNVGEQKQLTATIENDDLLENTMISWNSSDSQIVSVDENGNVTVNSVGTARISATLSDGTSAVCTITGVDANHEHEWDDGTVIFESTCTVRGNIEYRCNCGDTKIEELSLAQHEWEEEYTVDKRATIKAAGIQSRHCKNCDERTDISIIPILEDSESGLYDAEGNLIYTWDEMISKEFLCVTDGVLSANWNSWNELKGHLMISEEVTEIESWTFSDCYYLTSVTIPSSVTKIGDAAFSSNYLLEIDVDKNNSVYDSRDNCNAIIETETNTLIIGCVNSVIPESVTAIGNYAFYWCKGLKEIVLPNSLLTIGKSAFESSGIMHVSLPESLTAIEDYAFSDSDLGETLRIPKNLVQIGMNVFTYCHLEAIEVDDENPIFDSRDNCNSLVETETNTLLLGTVSSFIPEGITSIADRAFYACDIQEIVLPEGLTTIGMDAFGACSELKEVVIPDSVTKIDGWAFEDCYNLESFTFGKGVSEWSDIIFYISENLKKIYIPETMHYIESSLFEDVDVSNLSFYGLTGSYAEAFASDLGIKFVSEGTIEAGIVLDRTIASIKALETVQLNASCIPKDEDALLRWSSSNSSVASVDQNGLVTGISKGETVITVTKDGDDSYKRTCIIEVTCDVKICTSVAELESMHNYEADTDTYWIYTVKDAESLSVTFDQETNTEELYDQIYLYDAKDNEIGAYDGDELAGKTIIIAGNTVKIRLKSDTSVENWGFKVSDVIAEWPKIVVKGYEGTFDGKTHTLSISDLPKGAEVYYAEAENGPYTTKAISLKNAGSKTVYYKIVKEGFADIIGSEKIVVNKASISKKTATLSYTSTTYSGEAKKPSVEISGLKQGDDYTVSYSKNKNAGKATVTIKGCGNYTGTLTKTFMIKPAEITKLTLSATSYTYNGETKTPTVTVKAGSLTAASKIKADTSNIDVTYASGRKNAGSYKVTVKGIGNYTGTLTKTFKIKPAEITKLTLSATSYTYNGKAKTPTVTVKAGSLTAASKIKADTSKIDVTYASGRKNVGKYKVTVKGKGNYTGTLSKTFKINPKSTTISSVTAASKAFTLKWKKLTTQTTGYQIQYATSSSFSNAKTVTISKNTTVSKKISKLKSKKKYYVRVRTYKTVKGVKYYSSWSAKKSIKTK